MTMNVETPEQPVPTWSDVSAASAEAQAEPPKTVRRLVKSKLSTKAREDLMSQLLQELDDEKAIKAERKAVCADLKERLEECTAKIAGFSEALKSGTGVEEVECTETVDEDGRYVLTALDGTVLEAADVPAEKRQLSLADAKPVAEDGADEEDGDADDPDVRAFADDFDAAKFADASVTDITDPEGVLDGAAEDPDATAKPRRGRKKKS